MRTMFLTPRNAETRPPEERSKRHSPSRVRRGVTGSRLATMINLDLGAPPAWSTASSTFRVRSCSSCLFKALICAIRCDSLSFSRLFFCASSIVLRELGDMSTVRPVGVAAGGAGAEGSVGIECEKFERIFRSIFARVQHRAGPGQNDAGSSPSPPRRERLGHAF